MSAHAKDEFRDYHKSRHSVSKMVAHLIFTTRYRRKIFDGDMIETLRGSFESACEKLECKILGADGEADHFHLLIEYPPKLSISVMVNNLKATSSREFRSKYPGLSPRSKGAGLLWSRSYFAASAGGVTIETLKNYVESQNTPD